MRGGNRERLRQRHVLGGVLVSFLLAGFAYILVGVLVRMSRERRRHQPRSQSNDRQSPHVLRLLTTANSSCTLRRAGSSTPWKQLVSVLNLCVVFLQINAIAHAIRLRLQLRAFFLGHDAVRLRGGF